MTFGTSGIENTGRVNPHAALSLFVYRHFWGQWGRSILFLFFKNSSYLHTDHCANKATDVAVEETNRYRIEFLSSVEAPELYQFKKCIFKAFRPNINFLNFICLLILGKSIFYYFCKLCHNNCWTYDDIIIATVWYFFFALH